MKMFNQTTFRFKYWLTAALLSLSASVLAQENVDINLQGDGLPVATALAPVAMLLLLLRTRCSVERACSASRGARCCCIS